MKRKNLLIAASMLLTASLSACGGSGSKEKTPDLTGKFDFTVWCASEIVDLTKSQLETFAKTLPEGCEVAFEVDPVGEGEAAGKMTSDVESGADIYCFAQDQLARLVSAGAIDKITGSVKENVTKRNDAGSVAGGTFGGNLYAFPLTSDNGYFMYYDKSVVKESSVDDMTKVLADAKAANKMVYFNGSSAWYNAAYFFGAGCESTWETDEDNHFVKYTDTYNSAQGLLAARGLSEIVTHSQYVDDSAGGTAFNSDACVCISGTWDYAAVKAALGDNFACTDLPSFTAGGKSYHLGSFGGYKLMGVKPQTTVQRSYLAKQIASYLTDEECQLQRFNAKAWGPSNLKAQQSEAVKSNPGLVALGLQSKYAVPQGQYPGDWWNNAGAIGKDIKAAGANPSDAALQAILKAYSDTLEGMLTPVND